MFLPTVVEELVAPVVEFGLAAEGVEALAIAAMLGDMMGFS